MSQSQQQKKTTHKDPYRVSSYRKAYFGGLAAISLIVLQDLLSVNKLDISLYVATIAFAVALPLLALSTISEIVEEGSIDRSDGEEEGCLSYLSLVGIIQANWIGPLAAFVGIAGAFWHISSTASIVFICMSAFVVETFYQAYLVNTLRSGRIWPANVDTDQCDF